MYYLIFTYYYHFTYEFIKKILKKEFNDIFVSINTIQKKKPSKKLRKKIIKLDIIDTDSVDTDIIDTDSVDTDIVDTNIIGQSLNMIDHSSDAVEQPLNIE